MPLKSAEIQAEIDNKSALVDQEAAKGQQTNHEYIIQLRNEISILQMQLNDAKVEEAQHQDSQAQQQAQAAQIDGLKETIRSIRDAVYLKELMDIKLGLTENATNIQDFNSMVDQAVDEDQFALHATFTTQLEQRDEKFRALTLQALEVQNQLDKANGTIQSQDETIQLHEKTIADFTSKFAEDGNALQQKDIEIESLVQQLENAKETIFNLQQQIANVKPQSQIIDISPTKPSESLADKIAQAKVASVTKFSNLFSDVTFEDGTKQVVHNSLLPSLEIPVLPQMANGSVEQSNSAEQVTHPSEIPAGNTEGNTTVEGNAAIPESLGEKPAEETTLTLESLKAELDAIKADHGARLDNIERHANLPAVA